jgi:cold shock CspA family protein
MARSTVLRGTVVEFDEQVGLGRVRAEDGGDYPFHCTAVADGSRSVPVGAPVAFTLVPGKIGGWEADALVVTG